MSLRYIETVSVSASQVNHYKIVPFVYNVLNPTTATVIIDLSTATSYEDEYVIEVNKTDIVNNSVTSIDWPSTLVWEGDVEPDIDDFTTLGYDAWVVTIRNGKFASHKRYYKSTT